MLRQWSAEFGDGCFAGLLDIPIEVHASGFDDANCSVADLRPDAVTRDEGYRVPAQSRRTASLPVFEEVGVDLDEVAPLLRNLVLRKDRVDRTGIHACAAVDALVGVDVVHVGRVGGVDAVHGTDLHA